MKYEDYLLNVLKNRCPFCDMAKNYVIEQWEHFSVVLARAPYASDHLLIVPNRHFIRLSEIIPEEKITLIPLIEKWINNLECFHKEVNLLLRDWTADGAIWKSIDHLHFHLVPDCPLYSPAGWRSREVYSDYQLEKETAIFKAKFKWK